MAEAAESMDMKIDVIINKVKRMDYHDAMEKDDCQVLGVNLRKRKKLEPGGSEMPAKHAKTQSQQVKTRSQAQTGSSQVKTKSERVKTESEDYKLNSVKAESRLKLSAMQNSAHSEDVKRYNNHDNARDVSSDSLADLTDSALENSGTCNPESCPVKIEQGAFSSMVMVSVEATHDDIKTECDDITTENDDITTENDDIKTENDDIKTENDDIGLQADCAEDMDVSTLGYIDSEPDLLDSIPSVGYVDIRPDHDPDVCELKPLPEPVQEINIEKEESRKSELGKNGIYTCNICSRGFVSFLKLKIHQKHLCNKLNCNKLHQPNKDISTETAPQNEEPGPSPRKSRKSRKTSKTSSLKYGVKMYVSQLHHVRGQIKHVPAGVAATVPVACVGDTAVPVGGASINGSLPTNVQQHSNENSDVEEKLVVITPKTKTESSSDQESECSMECNSVPVGGATDHVDVFFPKSMQESSDKNSEVSENPIITNATGGATGGAIVQATGGAIRQAIGGATSGAISRAIGRAIGRATVNAEDSGGSSCNDDSPANDLKSKFPNLTYHLGIKGMIAAYEHPLYGTVHICDICEQGFLKADNLAKHLRIHLEKFQTCPICRLTFENIGCLKSHVAVHRGTANYVNDKPMVPEDLRGHIRYNNSEQCKPFVCNLCGFRSRQLSFLLRSHLRQHKHRNT